MNDLNGRRLRKKTIILAFFLSIWFLVLTLRLVQLQVIHHAHLKAEVTEQNQYINDLIPRRGTILDRNGVILARSLPVKSVSFATFNRDASALRAEWLRDLKEALGLTEKDIQRIKARVEQTGKFTWVKRKITWTEFEKVKNLQIPGILFQDENKRYYPLGSLAAHVLGGVNVDDRGLSGVELAYNIRLQGKIGKSLILRDAKKRKYHLEILQEPEPGSDLTLTIDETIQYIAERELRRAVENFSANWGTVIISRPASGEILAMANYPTYDPNDDRRLPSEAEVNRAIRHNFEPGSTFKIVTASAARESGSVSPAEVFDCSTGRHTVAGWTINDHKKMGILTFPEVFIHSSNVGAIQVGLRLGKDNLYNVIKAFHFGEKTGIGLPGEESGILHSLKSWSKTSLPAHAIGYEVSVTAIQILQAMNIIANRGVLVPPKIAREISQPLHETDSGDSPYPHIISAQTAAEIISILQKVVSEGTGTTAQVLGYPSAGKTGTAQKWDPDLKQYTGKKHISTFVGFVPADAPVLSMVIVLDEPKGDLYYGGQVAAPVFRDIASRVLLYLRIPPQTEPPFDGMVTAHIGNGESR